MDLENFAPAKVNLFLHVGAKALDGYHPIRSLMVFADIGDRVVFRPGEMNFQVEGPFAGDLAGEGGNLVLRARDAFLGAVETRARSCGLVLHKTLPVASGLGGGSSDAAATLRLLNEVLAAGAAGAACRRIASSLGSDVPACLAGGPTLARGRGEVLTAAPGLPDLDAVLVNPGVRVATAAVYAAFDEIGAVGPIEPPRGSRELATAEDVARYLGRARNDLEAPAVRLRPEIGEALALLRTRPQVLMARMSGSGGTCFALCHDTADASRLAARLKDDRPDWWIRRCRLAGA